MENVLEYVKGKWEQLTAFSKKQELKEQLWNNIVYRYSAQHRHYHNLSHIAFLFKQFDQYFNTIKNPGVIGFAIIYHDIFYDTYRKDNEEQSALIAEDHLKQLKLKEDFIENVKQFILATKEHLVPDDAALKDELSLFLDFDMSILAAEPDIYKLYSEKIRQEYSKYPDDIYKEGRKQALQSILKSPNIFATPMFREAKEEQARQNINMEVNLL